MATCNQTFASLLLTRPHNIDEYPAPWLGCKNHHGNKGDRLQQQWLVLSEAIITREMMWKLQPVYVGKRDCAAQSQSQSSSSECVRVGWRIMSGLLIADLKAANKNSMSDFGLAWLCAQASSFTSNLIEPVAMTSSRMRLSLRDSDCSSNVSRTFFFHLEASVLCTALPPLLLRLLQLQLHYLLQVKLQDLLR